MQVHQREDSLLQRTHLSGEQTTSRQSGRDFRTHQGLCILCKFKLIFEVNGSAITIFMAYRLNNK